MDPALERTKAALRDLLQSYAELNSTTIDELCEEPSALEFMRYVATNRPFVIRGGCTEWQASRKWHADYLRSAMEGKDINVAVTPLGYDACGCGCSAPPGLVSIADNTLQKRRRCFGAR